VAQIPDERPAADHDDEKNDGEEHCEEGFHGWILTTDERRCTQIKKGLNGFLFPFDPRSEGAIGVVAEG
jgi:hypothetical protein